MATFYNEYEVAELCERAARHPTIAPFARYLAAWVQIVNSHSDGWPYWTAASRAGGKLAELIKRALAGETIASGDWARAVGGVKRVATAQLRHGNTIPVPTLN